MKLHLLSLILLIINQWEGHSKIHNLCGKIHKRSYYEGGCRPMQYKNTTFESSRPEDLLIYQLNSYDLSSIVSSSQNVDSILGDILSDIHVKYFSNLNKKTINSLFNEIHNNSSQVFDAVEKLKIRIKMAIDQQKLPEVLIWFVQEKQLSKSQIDFVKRLWTQKSYFQLANYLSQYDAELLKQLSHQDPFEFNEDSQLLIQLFTKVQKRLNNTNSQNQLNVKRFLKQNRLFSNPIVLKNQVQTKLLEYLTKNECPQQFIQKASNLVNEKLFKQLIELIFPTSFDLILTHYQQIVKRFVIKQMDVLNILQLVKEGWMINKIENPCQQKYQYFEKAPEDHHLDNNFEQAPETHHLDNKFKQGKYYSIGSLNRPYQSHFSRFYDF